ncbi:MAG: response regulator [Oscillospiraceae bacterium]|jgi:signal transduction histidine kinase/DNA-binding response OmpR family regulator|nr:response regulator [Oscillospiraceae bacterium]
MLKFKSFINRHFLDDTLPFDSRILNFVCLLGAISSAIALVLRFVAGMPFISAAPLIVMIAAIASIFFLSIRKTEHTAFLTNTIVCAISIVFWPVLFFTVGGAGSGMAVYFAFAIILDFTLLKGKTRAIALIVTSIVTVICYVTTLFLNWKVLPEGGLNTYQLFIDSLQSIFIVGFLMGIIILFQTRIYQREKNKVESANEEIKHSEYLTTLLNEAAITLLKLDPDRFEETLTESMAKIAVNLEIDCIIIWQADEQDGVPVYRKLYGIKSPNAGKLMSIEEVSGGNTLTRTKEWDERLLEGDGYLSGSVSSFSGYNFDAINDSGIKTIIAFPLFFQSGYWGFVSFDNRHSDRLCSDRDATILHSVSLLIANAIERNVSMLKLNSAQITVASMFEANPHINILFDSSFKVVDCNPAAFRFMGAKSKEEMLDGFLEYMLKSVPAYQPDGRVSIPLAERLVTAATEGYSKFETEMHLPDGGIRILNVELKRIPYENNFALVGYIIDMTEVHEREMELKRRDQLLSEAVEEAKAANHAKSAFLSSMSHEIRTPMNAILGIAEIQLQNEALDPDTLSALSKIYSSGDMLLEIINDILDLSKIEAGKLELAIDKYEIASLISDTVQLNMMRIGSKPIEFELNVDENIPAVLSGDELRVKQILNNILSNAFKYTAAGRVVLSITTEPFRSGDVDITLIIRIRDTGQGMTEEQIGKLFDEYARFNIETNRSTEGTGLGMSITQNLLRLMNGKIYVESEPGKGSIFTVHLPQTRIGLDLLGKEVAENLRNFRTSSRAQMKRVQISREAMPYGSVLIVDDVETNIYVAKGLLAPYELKIESAESGFEAIEKIKHGNVYDIIFMDHMMPKMDGIEATKIIREIGYDRPIVALTANAVSGQAEVFLSNGFDDFISKPIDVRQLNVVLNKLIRDKQPHGVIGTAREQIEVKTNNNERPPRKDLPPGVDQRFIEAFVRDAKKSLAALYEIIDKDGAYSEDDIRMYTIHVHGIKSALAGIGQHELSAEALRLETAAREGNMEVVLSKSAAFTESLQALVDEFMPE